MCISAATAMLIASTTAAVAGAATSIDNARSARNTAADRAREAAALETTAAQSANERIAQRRRALGRNSLLTGAPAAEPVNGLASTQRATLGGQ